MSSGIKEWIYNIILFVMFSSLLLQLSAAKKYDKYIKFFTGLILVIVVILPIAKLSGSDKILEMNYLNECFMQAADDAAEEMENLEQVQSETISQSYEKNIQISIESIVNSYGYDLVNADVTINSDVNDNMFCYPKQIYATVRIGLHNGEEVKNIIINKIESGIKNKDDSGYEMEKKIAEFFSLEEGDVTVEII